MNWHAQDHGDLEWADTFKVKVKFIYLTCLAKNSVILVSYSVSVSVSLSLGVGGRREATHTGIQGLFLALCLGITHGRTQGTIWSVQD